MNIQGSGSGAQRSGRGGRRFKSCHSDQYLAQFRDKSATPCATTWRTSIGRLSRAARSRSTRPFTTMAVTVAPAGKCFLDMLGVFG